MKVAVISAGGKKTSQAMLILQGTLPGFVIESVAKLQLEVSENNDVMFPCSVHRPPTPAPALLSLQTFLVKKPGGMVAPAWNPSHVGGRGRRITGSDNLVTLSRNERTKGPWDMSQGYTACLILRALESILRTARDGGGERREREKRGGGESLATISTCLMSREACKVGWCFLLETITLHTDNDPNIEGLCD